jgi:hypothetical protein
MNDRTGWLRYMVRPLILAGMLAIIGGAIVQLVQLFLPTWDGRYISALVVFLVIETHISHQFLKRQSMQVGERLRYRLAEALLLFLVTRFAPYLVPSGWERWGELQGWLLNPQAIVLDGETWIVYLILLVFWQSIHGTLNDFTRIDGRVQEGNRAYSLTTVYQDRLELQLNSLETQQAHQSLLNRFLQGGIVLLLVTGMSSIELTALTDFARPPITRGFAGIGFYFLCGLLMIGILRYSVMRRKWQTEYVNVEAGVARGWLGYLLLLIGVGVVAALLMPAGYSLPLLGVVAEGMQLIFSVLAFIGLLLFLIITFPIVWVLWFISSFFGNESEPPQFTPPAPPPMVAPMSEGTDWFALVRATILWVLLLGLLWFTLRTYLRDKNLPEQYPRLARWWATFKQWWTELWAWLTMRQQQLVELVTAGVGWRRPSKPSSRRARPPVATHPVVNLYLRLLRRTQAQGVYRDAADTPYEYDEKLSDRYPMVKTEIDQLTAAFVEARYSDHPVSAADVAQSQAAWHRIKAALKDIETGADKHENTSP